MQKKILFVCHDFVENIDRRVLNFAYELVADGHAIVVVGIARGRNKTVQKTSDNLTIIGAPALSLNYSHKSWTKGAIDWTEINWDAIESFYVMKRRSFGMLLEKYAPPVRVLLLSLRSIIKRRVRQFIIFTQASTPITEMTPVLSEFETALKNAKQRELAASEIANLNLLASGNGRRLKLGRMTAEDFNPLPFTELFENVLSDLETPHLLIACDLPSLPAAVTFKSQRGCKLLYDAHEFYPFQKEFTRRQKLHLAQEESICLRSVDAITTVSDLIVESYMAIYGKNSECINNAPKFIETVSGPGLTKFASQLANKVVLLYHGGFSKGRQLVELADAFRKLNIDSTAMVYVGEGELKNTFLEIQTKSKNFHVMDSVPQEHVPSLIRDADLLVISYPALDENTRRAYPNKLGDAIELGVPIIGNADMRNLASICERFGIGFCGPMHSNDSIQKTLMEGLAWYNQNSHDLPERFESARAALGWSEQIRKFRSLTHDLLASVGSN